MLVEILLVILTLYAICNTIILFLLIPAVWELQQRELQREVFCHPTMPNLLDDES